MPNYEPNEEPDEELIEFFPKTISQREIEANSQLAENMYNLLYRRATSLNVVNKRLRIDNRTLYQEKLLLTEENKAFKENEERSKKSSGTEALLFLLEFIGGVTATIGIVVDLFVEDQLKPLGWLLFFIGIIIGVAALIYHIRAKKS